MDIEMDKDIEPRSPSLIVDEIAQGSSSSITVHKSHADSSRTFTSTVSKNVALSVLRVLVNSVVAIALPAYLTHKLPVSTYGAWVLILQLAAFVSFLDFGVQTGVAKFVAEHDSAGDINMAGRYASAGLVLMSVTGFLGVLLSIVLAWQVPRLFKTMPAVLYHDTRISLLLVGISLSFGLVCSVFSAVFLGLQRYAIPMSIAVINRICFSLAVVISLMLHGQLIAMGGAVAIVNIMTSIMYIIAWRKSASHISISLYSVDRQTLRRMAVYCFLLAVWTVGMLCVSGLDLTIVGHYDYSQIAFYSVATLPTNFLGVLITAMIGPMMPATSSLSMRRTSNEMGMLLANVTRYSTLLLLLTGLPFIIYGFWILRIWVGPTYAANSLYYLRILIIANIIRNLCAPYATMVVATAKQGAATVTAISEAVVNLGSSIYLASHFGAMGVAIGTLLGSFVSVLFHFLVTMRYTQNNMKVGRSELLASGIMRPLSITIPSVGIIIYFASGFRFEAGSICLWALGTLLFAWFGVLSRNERVSLKDFTLKVFPT